MSNKISEEMKTLVYLAYPLISNPELAEYVGCSKVWIEKFGQKNKIKKAEYCFINNQFGLLNLEGEIFGKLKVIRRMPYKSKNNIVWECECECGKILKCRSSLLRKGLHTSCNFCKNKTVKKERIKSGEIGSWIWAKIKSHAHERGIEVNITFQEALEIFNMQKGKCAISGMELEFPRIINNIKYGTASFDRIDNSRGYEKNNVQWVHKRINEMKNKHTDEELINFCHTVSDFQRSKEKSNNV